LASNTGRITVEGRTGVRFTGVASQNAGKDAGIEHQAFRVVVGCSKFDEGLRERVLVAKLHQRHFGHIAPE